MKKQIFTLLILMFLLTGCGNKSLKDDYPETLPDTVVWTEYPDNNIFGLCGTGTYEDQGTSTLILSFRGSKARVSKTILLKPEYLQGACLYGNFDFDEKTVYEKPDHFYVKLCYDSRIDMTDIRFDKGDERCVISLGNETVLFYLNMENLNKVKKLSQSYDTAAMSWCDASEETKDDSNNVSTGHSEYSRLTVDESEYEASGITDGVVFSATDYKRISDRYNIFGEIEEAGTTTLEFTLRCDLDRDLEQDSFRLYKKEDGVYTDITPSDISLTTNPGNYGNYLFLFIESSDLGELTEGDYRAEYGPYSVDFKMSNQLYVVD